MAPGVLTMDPDKSIEHHRGVLAQLSADDPNRPTLLDHLAISHHRRFQQRKQMQDLDEAITLFRSALALRPEGHPERSVSLNNVAVSLPAIHSAYIVDEEKWQDYSCTSRDCEGLEREEARQCDQV